MVLGSKVITDVDTVDGFHVGDRPLTIPTIGNDGYISPKLINTTPIEALIPYYRIFRPRFGALVQGSWNWVANASAVLSAPVGGDGAGYWANSGTHNDLDEYSWSMYLPAGSYEVTIYFPLNTNFGNAELLVGANSIGTIGQYNAFPMYNMKAALDFTLSSTSTTTMRLRCNGKNASSTDYQVNMQMLQIEKVG